MKKLISAILVALGIWIVYGFFTKSYEIEVLGIFLLGLIVGFSLNRPKKTS